MLRETSARCGGGPGTFLDKRPYQVTRNRANFGSVGSVRGALTTGHQLIADRLSAPRYVHTATGLQAMHLSCIEDRCMP